MRNNKTCVACGKSFYYCPRCGQHRSMPRWHNLYCSENCKTLFHSTTDYFANILSEDEAIEIVQKADLTNLKNFNKGVQRFVKEIKEKIQNKDKTNKNKNSSNIDSENN